MHYNKAFWYKILYSMILSILVLVIGICILVYGWIDTYWFPLNLFFRKIEVF